jgi:hypothetical protein
MPSRPLLLLLLALVVVPPFAAQASGTVVGSYTMFNRIERYHLDLTTTTTRGDERVTVRSIAPHLSAEARRILLPADGYAAGADQLDLTLAGLADLAQLLCSLDPAATRARARLVRDHFDPAQAVTRERVVPCQAQR